MTFVSSSRSFALIPDRPTFSGIGCKHQFERAARRRDRVVHRLEDVRRGELIHRDGEPLLRAGQECLELAPAGLRADTDGELHVLVDKRQQRRIERLIAAAFGWGEFQSFLAGEECLERRGDGRRRRIRSSPVPLRARSPPSARRPRRRPRTPARPTFARRGRVNGLRARPDRHDDRGDRRGSGRHRRNPVAPR